MKDEKFLSTIAMLSVMSINDRNVVMELLDAQEKTYHLMRNILRESDDVTDAQILYDSFKSTVKYTCQHDLKNISYSVVREMMGFEKTDKLCKNVFQKQLKKGDNLWI